MGGRTDSFVGPFPASFLFGGRIDSFRAASLFWADEQIPFVGPTLASFFGRRTGSLHMVTFFLGGRTGSFRRHLAALILFGRRTDSFRTALLFSGGRTDFFRRLLPRPHFSADEQIPFMRPHFFGRRTDSFRRPLSCLI